MITQAALRFANWNYRLAWVPVGFQSQQEPCLRLADVHRLVLRYSDWVWLSQQAVVAVPSQSPVWFSATPWTAARQISLSCTISLSLLKLRSIESIQFSHSEICKNKLPFSSHSVCGVYYGNESELTFALRCSHGTFRVVLSVKNLPASAGDRRDPGVTPGSGRSPEGGPGSPLQYSCLENPMDRGAWRAIVQRVTKSQKWLKWLSAYTKCSQNIFSMTSYLLCIIIYHYSYYWMFQLSKCIYILIMIDFHRRKLPEIFLNKNKAQI